MRSTARMWCCGLVFLFAGLFGGIRADGAQSPREEIAEQVPAALKIVNAWQADLPERAERKVHIVYWTPADREPAPRYQERLSKIMLDIQSFYLAEMQRMGFGKRTIRLDLETPEKLKIHLVNGEKPYAAYDVKSGSAIRKECLPTLRAAGLEPDKETIVIFCNMSNWDAAAGTMSQNSPYYAGGSLRGGTAWQVDSPLLDLDLLAKKEPLIKDGQYGRISVGKYNSIFIGGIAHELGHALGLPHNAERPDQREAFGTALMGGGNRTYGDDRRGEGRGSVLTLAHGLRLAAHPVFCGSVKGINLPATAKLHDIAIEPSGKTFTFSARVTADPPAYAVIGYMDPAGGSDYDAATCTAIPNGDGRFSLQCAALKAGKAGVLRIVVCQANGGRIGDETYAVPYQVAADGTVDLSAAVATLKLAPLVRAVNAGDAASAAEELKKLENGKADEPTLTTARSLIGTMKPTTGPGPADVKGNRCNLSDAAWVSARVGWGKPVANRLPGDGALLKCTGRLFARGLYGHAPSAYRWDLAGSWKTLTGHAGMADGYNGTVVFVILGDGKELWRSKKIEAGGLTEYSVGVDGVKELELRVTNADDGNASDWGVWLDPVLTR